MRVEVAHRLEARGYDELRIEQRFADVRHDQPIGNRATIRDDGAGEQVERIAGYDVTCVEGEANVSRTRERRDGLARVSLAEVEESMRPRLGRADHEKHGWMRVHVELNPPLDGYGFVSGVDFPFRK